MVEVLSALPARPPTPPRTTSNGFIDITTLTTGSTSGRFGLLGTPGDSPSSTNASANLSTGARSKRVNFSPWTNYIKPPTFSGQMTTTKNELRALPRSNDCKPSKSILKITTTSPLPSPSHEERETTMPFGMLLESVVRQLAGDSLSSRLDAYMHLLGALKTYEGVPDEQAMVHKLGQLTQFIQRDICRGIETGDPHDVNLIIQALKLAIYLAWNSTTSSQLHEEFRVFIIDQSIQTLQDAKAPKSILNHYMHLLSTQNFHAKTMTTTRIVRILSALKDVTNFVNGNGIVAQRLSVYQRLLSQSKTAMAAQSNLWTEHFISGMLHQVKDTRSRAISFGMQLSVVLGPNLMVSNTIRDIFNKPIEKGGKLVSEICERMSRLMSHAESGAHVPQIWSIIVLLLRSKKSVIAQWEHFKEWVLVLQKCFNCSDQAIKAQAILAWNRFVYAVTPMESTSLSIIRMLSKPILSQFERKKHDKPSAAPSQLSLSSYYNLLYYALHPASSFQHLDVVWEEYIAQPFDHTFASSPFLNDQACRVLKTLVWSSSVKVWNENTVNETNKLDPETLPSLDSRWIRSRINTILKVYETMFKSADWKSSVEDSEIAAAWSSLCKAISDASNKEIKPSAELMQAVAAVLGLLQRLWNLGPSSLNAGSDDRFDGFFDRFSFIATTAIATIGSIPFTEKLLQKTAQETFLTANSPTHRRAPTDINFDTPFMHLLRLTTSVPRLTGPTTTYLQLVDGLLEAASRGRTSRGSQLDFLERCTEVYTNDFDNTSISPFNFAQTVWDAIARLTEDSLRSSPTESARERDGTVVRDYDNVVKILLRGLSFPLTRHVWSKLLDTLIHAVRTERGEGAITKIIIEPIVEKLKQLDLNQIFSPSAVLIDKVHMLPAYQQNKSHSIAGPIGLTLSSTRSEELIFPKILIELLERVLLGSYQMVAATSESGIAEVLEVLTSLLSSNILTFRSSLLDRLQTPCAVWVNDESHHLTSESCDNRRLLTATRSLSFAVANILQSAISHSEADLAKYEAIISAGLGSTHKSIANRFIKMWNNTFGLQESLEYPENVLKALRKLMPYVELQLSSLPLVLDKQVDQDFLRPAGSQESQLDTIEDSYFSTKSVAHLRTSRIQGFSSSPIVSTDEASQTLLLEEQQNLTPKRRLRHDDSQVQFVAVESSPSVPSDQDSHLLTARQKEVKERQRNETSKFLDGLRSSSPGLPSPSDVVDVCRSLQPPGLGEPEPVQEIALTPTLPATVLEHEDVFPGSSPTPSAKTRYQIEEIGDGPTSSMQVLEALTVSDIPSSPPEIKPQAPKRRVSARRKSNRHSKLALSDDQEKVVESSEPLVSLGNALQSDVVFMNDTAKQVDLGRSILLPLVHEHDTSPPASEEIASKTADKHDPAPNEMPNQQSDADQEAATDDLEMQLASQLEQDLELAVDLDEIRETQSQSEPAPSAPMTRKRKREQEQEIPSPAVERKRRSLRSSAVATKPASLEKAGKTEMFTRQVGRRSSISAPEPVLTNEVSKGSYSHSKTNANPQEKVKSADFGRKPTSKRRGETVGHAEPKEVPPSTNMESPPHKRRRSSRLSGVQSTPIDEQDNAPPTKRRERPRSKDARVSDPEDSTTSLSNSISEKPTTVEKAVASTHRAPDEAADSSRALSTDGGSMSVQREFAQAQDSGAGGKRARADNVPNGEINLQDISDTVHMEDVTSHGDHIDGEPTEARILASLRSVLGNIKRVTFGRETLREIDDLMFDIRFEAHEVVRRQGN